MKVIIDTNVLVSAIICDKTPEAIIKWVITQDNWQWIASPDILKEYKDVLQRKKFKLKQDFIQAWFQLFDETIEIIYPQIEMSFSRDQKDVKFLICAMEANADIFITGDKDFEEAHQLIDSCILSVEQFKQLFL